MKFPYIVNVCYLINERDEVLLQHKRRGFGKGKWNGPGGKVRPGEDLEKAVIREVQEETTIIINNLKKLGVLEFVFVDQEDWNNLMHVYISSDWSGEAKDTGEGELKWFKFADIPYDKMWEDDRIWLPRALEEKEVNMRFNMNKQGRVLSIKYLKKKK